MASQNEDAIAQFCALTGADPQTATHFLEASNYNLELASQQFFDAQEGDNNNAMETDEPAAPPAPVASSSTAPPAAAASSSRKQKSTARTGGARIRTLGDVSKDESEDEDDHKQDFFAGGEKSGLAVQNPGEGAGPSSGPSLINDILKRAAEGSRHIREEQTPEQQSRFEGTGYTLGSDEEPSAPVVNPAAAARPLPSVTRNLTFWRQGFSVEDGPLMRYDDPANREILAAIERGRAPLSLMNVQPGQPAEVNVYKRLEEDYVPPKKKFVPFSGQGQRLGSALPGESSSSAAAAPEAAPAAAPATTSAAPAAPQPPAVNIDSSAPTTNVQIRLGDGTRLVCRFNHTHTVQELYDFVNASSVSSRERSYVLQTTFPNKELKDMGLTLKEAGLINAVVVQKWA